MGGGGGRKKKGRITMQIKLYKTNSRLHIRGIDRCPIVKSILSSGWSGTRIEPFHLWPRFFYGKTKFVFFVVAALAVFDNERGKGGGEERRKKKKKKKSGPVQMTRINGKSWRIKKLEKFFNRFPPLLIFDSQENQYQYYRNLFL